MLDPHVAIHSNVFIMGYVTSFWVLCDTLSQCFISGVSVYILRCLHLPSSPSKLSTLGLTSISIF